MNGVLNFIVSVATTPALLVGLIAMLGLILQKKPATAVIQGSVKTFAGFLVLVGGAGILVGALAPFADMFQHAFHGKVLSQRMKVLLPWHSWSMGHRLP